MKTRRWWLRNARRVGAALVLLALLLFAAAVSGAVRPRWPAGAASGAVFAGLIAFGVWVRWRRERAVREAALPQFLKRRLRETWPHLDGKDCDLVERGLRQFFVACQRSDGKFVAMPSKVVDAMWHEFILHTRAYRDWCELVLGRFLHHTPAEALAGDAGRNDGLRRAWYWACRDEAIDPRHPTRLPLLFALDAKLKIEGGFRYLPDCRAIRAQGEANATVYCGSSFSDGTSSGDADGFGGSDGGGDDGGDGGGCGGD